MYNYVPFITFILSSLLDAEATTPAYVAQESRVRYRHLLTRPGLSSQVRPYHACAHLGHQLDSTKITSEYKSLFDGEFSHSTNHSTLDHV